MNTQTKTVTYFPISGVLLELEKMLGAGNDAWLSSNYQLQGKFLRRFHDRSRSYLELIPEISSIAGPDVGAVNKFLAEKGYKIRLDDRGDNALYAASVLDLLLKWLTPGDKTEITAKNGQKYPGFALPVDDDRVMSFREVECQFGCGLLIRISTKNDDTVNVFVPNELDFNSEYINGLVIDDLAHNDCHFELLSTKSLSFDKLVLPMINLDQEEDVSWLKGLNIIDDGDRAWYIAQALQQTKLRMNQFGARVQSAVAVGMMRACLPQPKKRYVVDRPFFMWIERPDILFPLFVGYLDYDCWADPGSLE